jgi:hypothetical protein
LHRRWKGPGDFATQAEYGSYLKQNLKQGMAIEMLRDFDALEKGDRGTYIGTNNMMPPCHAEWQGHGGKYWVHWKDIRVVGAAPAAGRAAAGSTSALRGSSDADEFFQSNIVEFRRSEPRAPGEAASASRELTHRGRRAGRDSSPTSPAASGRSRASTAGSSARAGRRPRSGWSANPAPPATFATAGTRLTQGVRCRSGGTCCRAGRTAATTWSAPRSRRSGPASATSPR